MGGTLCRHRNRITGYNGSAGMAHVSSRAAPFDEVDDYYPPLAPLFPAVSPLGPSATLQYRSPCYDPPCVSLITAPQCCSATIQSRPPSSVLQWHRPFPVLSVPKTTPHAASTVPKIFFCHNPYTFVGYELMVEIQCVCRSQDQCTCCSTLKHAMASALLSEGAPNTFSDKA